MSGDFEKDGFTDESLKMLESAEGQNNAVFAVFGSAAQHAQLFEQSLKRFLSKANRIASEAVNLEDMETFDAKLSKKTMGGLLKDLSKKVTFPDASVGDRLDKALGVRNFLIHRAAAGL